MQVTQTENIFSTSIEYSTAEIINVGWILDILHAGNDGREVLGGMELTAGGGVERRCDVSVPE